MRDTKNKILDAARVLFCEKGYAATSVQDILDRTGTGKGQFYHYFASKQDLCLAVIDGHVAEWEEECFQAMLESDAPPDIALSDMLDWIYDYHAQQIRYYGCPVGNLIMELSTADEAFRQPLAAMYSRWSRLLAERIGQLTNMPADKAQSQALQLIASIQGSLLLLKLNQDIDALETSFDFLKNTILKWEKENENEIYS